MGLQTWWLFVLMTFVVSATPGPNMLLVMSHGARFGLRSAIWTMAGCMTALIGMVSISAAGVGALLHSFPAVFDALRYLGAAYLAYLGYNLWRAGVPKDDVPVHAVLPEMAQRSAGSHYRQGLAVAASNPKAIVFATAFFPQFIQADRPAGLQFAVLLITFTVIEVGWYLIYAVSGHKLSRFLQQAHVLKNFNRITGGVFVGFAAMMAASR
ncbi:LysE family translocator [Limnohabitans sp. Bal53]|uniref:LysE family translocator n=1 Tax=Limnohabitans sp. Bal53 TaxID=1977910 RepID=UPI000D3A468B|nr:LysE family translocator [Limnohabitans sp. Bal53]PUE41548.1 amino acid transporter [Limnohabitans sp. Bal53]